HLAARLEENRVGNVQPVERPVPTRFVRDQRPLISVDEDTLPPAGADGVLSPGPDQRRVCGVAVQKDAEGALAPPRLLVRRIGDDAYRGAQIAATAAHARQDLKGLAKRSWTQPVP